MARELHGNGRAKHTGEGAWGVSEGNLPQSPYFRLETLADGVWLAVATLGTGAMGNAGIVDLGGATLVFDTMMTPAAARDLSAAAQSLTGRPPRYVVNSHFHGDHVTGNTVFGEAVIFATEQTSALIGEHTSGLIAELREHGPELDAQARAEAATIADPLARRDQELEIEDFAALMRQANETEVRLPDVLFASRLTLRGAARTAELITWGGGHTPSDVLLYLPTDRILFAGDLMFYRMHPSINFGNPHEWLRILGEMEKLDFTTLAPGHGEAAPHEAIAEEREYLETVLALVRDAVAAGKTADEVTATPIPERYRSWGFAHGFPHTLRALYGCETAPAESHTNA